MQLYIYLQGNVGILELLVGDTAAIPSVVVSRVVVVASRNVDTVEVRTGSIVKYVVFTSASVDTEGSVVLDDVAMTLVLTTGSVISSDVFSGLVTMVVEIMWSVTTALEVTVGVVAMLVVISGCVIMALVVVAMVVILLGSVVTALEIT